MDTRLPKHILREQAETEPVFKIQVSYKTELAEEARRNGFDCENVKGVLTFYLKAETEAEATEERKEILAYLGLKSLEDVPPFSYAMKSRKYESIRQIVEPLSTEGD